MNDQQRWRRSGIVAGIVGGFALLLFLLIAGFAGERLANIGQSGWAALVAVLTACGTTAVACGSVAWQQQRRIKAKADPRSVAGLRQHYDAYEGVAGVCMILFFALPIVRVRQTYWSWAPWAALLSALICAMVAVWAWRASLRLQNQYYRTMAPTQLWQEIQRHRPKTFNRAQRLVIVAAVFALAQLTFQCVGLLMGWTDDTFPPRMVRTWMSWLQPFPFLSVATVLRSQTRLVERWRQTFHIARG